MPAGKSKKRRDSDCPVCKKPQGRQLIAIVETCKCPWDKPFEHWPRNLLNTVQALVRGGPRED